MLDQAITQQLATHLERVTLPVALVASLDDSKTSVELSWIQRITKKQWKELKQFANRFLLVRPKRTRKSICMDGLTRKELIQA